MTLSIWKPKGPSSHFIVNQIRRITGEKRVGHAGTLDPLASGVLIIGIGRESTKQLSQFMNQDKEYQTLIHLGETSTTDDAEGEKTSRDKPLQRRAKAWVVPTHQQIDQTIRKFIGTIDQVPPAFSAIKVKGQKSYDLARKGKSVELTARPVHIYSIDIEKYNYPELELIINCGKGTYIRSLARDIGEELGTGAYMAELTRTRVGEFTKENSLTIEEFQKQWENNGGLSV